MSVDCTPHESEISWGKKPAENPRETPLCADTYWELMHAATLGECMDILEREMDGYRLSLFLSLDQAAADRLELIDLRQQLAEARQMIADLTNGRLS